MSGQRLETVNIEDIKIAQQRLQCVIKPSPVVSIETLNMAIQKKVIIKAESLLPVGSFKLRGAYNKIASISNEDRNKGVITASAGNHAMGVALASRWLSGKATVVVPETAPGIKKKTCTALGADVEEYGTTYDDAYSRAREIEQEYGKTYVHPVADADVVAGQGTIGSEILEQVPHVKQIVVPLGGGGLVSGIAIAVKNINPSVRVVAVQPEGSCAYYKSIMENRLVELDQLNTIADGLAVKKVEPYLLDLIKKWVDDVVLVREETIKEALKTMFLKGKLVVEGAGAVSLAAVMDDLVDCQEGTVIIASGGNIDRSNLIQLLK